MDLKAPKHEKRLHHVTGKFAVFKKKKTLIMDKPADEPYASK